MAPPRYLEGVRAQDARAVIARHQFRIAPVVSTGNRLAVPAAGRGHDDEMPTLGDDPALDAQTQAPALYVLSGVFLAAASMAVALRMYNRAIIRDALGIDDWLIFLAMVRRPKWCSEWPGG